MGTTSGAASSGSAVHTTTSTSGSGTTGTCGAPNFDLLCSGAGGAANYNCPDHGTCAGSNACGCEDGYLQLNCAGELCSGNCAYPDWWCAPRQAGACGAANFSVPCPDGTGGTFYCPSTSACGTNNSCSCAAGEIAVSCSGITCSSANPCSYPDWWCTTQTATGSSTTSTGGSSSSGSGGTSGGTLCPLPQGTTGASSCGAQNFVTPCALPNGNTIYCPLNATCDPRGGCDCPLGFNTQDCSGNACSGSGCAYPNWWCAPDAPPSAPGSIDNGTCTPCTLGSSSCGGGATCIPVRPGSSQGICAAACDGTLGCADPHSTCVDPGPNGALCYPWACLGLGEPAPACGIAHEPWPQVPNQGSAGVSALAAEIITFAPWDGGAYPYVAQMEAWGQSVMGGTYPVAASGEYGIQSSAYAGAVHLTSPPPPVLYDSDIRSMVVSLLSSNAVSYAPGTVYEFFIPGSTTYYRDPNSSVALCAELVGYHSSTVYNAQPVLYAVIGDCGGATTFALDDLQSIMVTASHEIMEAATDPVNEGSWAYPYPFPHQDPWANAGGEVGDMCDWDTESVDSQGDLVQRVFSNRLAAQGGDPCAPSVSRPAAAVSSLPYSVLASAGASVRVPLIGWSTDPNTVTWVELGYLSGQSLSLPVSLPLNAIVPVTLTAPSSSGAYLVNLVAAAPGASFTLWPIYVEAN